RNTHAEERRIMSHTGPEENLLVDLVT
ncbi:unnamed protein product, partial [Allacma fusca]